MDIPKPKATLGQLDYLLKHIMGSGGIAKQFDTEAVYKAIRGISENQYKWLMHYASISEIYDFLIQKGLKPKI